MARPSLRTRFLQSASRPLGNERGVALLLSLVAVMMLIFIAKEVSYDSTVDYIVARQQVDRIKAYYAAKSGAELSLLRIMLYKQATAALGSSLPQANMLDPIWNFPFMWPPALALAKADGMSEIDKGALKESTKESLMQAEYVTTIAPEGGRLDINDLGSPNKAFAKIIMAQVLGIFKTELEHNEKFRRKYSGFRFEEMVNNIADYIDEDTESRNGGDESGPYVDLSTASLKLPPNRALRTLDELHLVAGVTDELYDLLATRVTVFGTKGININYAPKDVLMSLDPTMTSETADKVMERRGNPKLGGPFKDDKDFFAFLNGLNVNTRTMTEAKFPFLYDTEINFRITSTGRSSNVKREVVAVTYDYPQLANRVAEMMNKAEQTAAGGAAGAGAAPGAGDPAAGGAPGAAAADKKDKKIPGAKGRPTVVYWEEN